MAGIIFFNTEKLEDIRSFYLNIPGIELWLKQEECIILKFGNMLVGFCQRESTDTQGMITFVYDTRNEVDEMYVWCVKNKVKIRSKTKENPKYRIYHFFAEDPDGRAIEFQYFWDPTKPYC